MKIYDAEGLPNPARVRIALADGTHISQCNAITEYIDGFFDGPSLTGETPRQRARSAMMNLRPEWGKRQKQVAQQSMTYLDGELSKNDFLAGPEFSVADITAYAGLAFADFTKVDNPEGLSNQTAWRARVATRPSIAG